MFSISIEKSVLGDLSAMRKRADDWTPMSQKFRQSVRDFHKKRDIGGDTGTIQASVSNPDVWRIQPTILTYGTSIDYAEYYARWRRDNGLSELVLSEPINAIADVWAEYITTGRT